MSTIIENIWLPLTIIFFAVILFLKRKTVITTVTSRLKAFTKISPLFWAIFFLIITILIWTNGGAISANSQTMTWKTITALVSSEISIGFLVAWILIYFVEKPAKETAAKDFAEKQAILSQNIFKYVYGVELPEGLFKHIENKILTPPFYRRNYTIEYNFTRKIKDRFLIKVDIQCDVFNLTDKKQKFPIRGGIERPHNETGTDEQTLGLTKLFINNKAIKEDVLTKARARIQDTKEDFRFEHFHEILPNESINVKITLWMTKRSRDYEIFRVLENTESVKMKLIFSQQLSIKASPIHPNKEFSHRDVSENSFSVEMNYPLTPHNGILLWWGDSHDTNN